MAKILIVDLANATHRARGGGFKLGNTPVVYNFFRSLRPLVEKMSPTRVFLVDEGRPRDRLKAFPEYKANRKIPDKDVDRLEDLKRYREQRDVIHDLLRNFPCPIVRHPDYEADDVVYHIVSRGSPAAEHVVVSTDSDFFQLLDSFSHVSVYNPIKKEFLKKTQYDYVVWKSLRGDVSDNIPPVAGFGDKRAEEYARDPDLLRTLSPNETREFVRNSFLVTLREVNESEFSGWTCTTPTRDWERVRSKFDEFGFGSITNEVSWKKFVSTFDYLFEIHK